MPRRAKIQGLPAPTHLAEPGLVQGVSGFDGNRSRKEHAPPKGPGGFIDERGRGPRMGGVVMKQSEVEYRDIQGLVRFGYGKMKGASYDLLRVKDAAAARAWLRSAPVTTAVVM